MRATIAGLVRRVTSSDARTDGDQVHPLAGYVLSTGLFDPDLYRREAGLDGASDVRAASHYVQVGELEGLRPSASFDPCTYRSMNPDLPAEGTCLLVHYAAHGRAEGRVATWDPVAHVRPGGQAPGNGRSTVLVACHEASRTGAPILAWNLARRLSLDHDVVLAVAHPDGDLLDAFAGVATHVVGPFDHVRLKPPFMRAFGRWLADRFGFDHVVASSVECQPMLVGLAEAGVPIVTLAHEYPVTVDPMEVMRLSLVQSTSVVFDAASQVDAVRATWPDLDGSRWHVRHQGASEIPPDPRRSPAERAAAIEAAVARARGTADVPLVLGLGTVSMRKGVDLFVSCAQALASRLGPGQVRFAWVGHCQDPHPEGPFKVFLDDQAARSGLGEDLVFLDAVDDLAPLYEAAAAVLVPSRLDAFPNTAMDAALARRPVVCFAKANGFADWLADDPRTEFLAVPYLDVAAAASVIAELLDDPAWGEDVGTVLEERARRDFDVGLHLDRLAPVIAQAKAHADGRRTPAG